MAVAIGLAGSGLLVFYYIGIMSIFAQKGELETCLLQPFLAYSLSAVSAAAPLFRADTALQALPVMH
jgi:hypothetical protein